MTLESWSAIVFLSVLFLTWNTWPELIERVGYFLIAHAKSLRERSVTYSKLKEKGI